MKFADKLNSDRYSDPSWLGSDDVERLSKLIGDIYDVILKPTTWPCVLRRCSEFVPGHATSLFAKGLGAGDVYFDDGNIDAAYRKSYFSTYVKIDPFSVAQFFAELGVPVAASDFMPFSELAETALYQEWAQPQGLVDFVSVKLESSLEKATSFGVFRHERHGAIDDEARRRINLLVPHIRRAVSISRIAEFKALEGAALADTLDAVSAAMILVDAQGRVTHVNAAGQTMLSDRDMIELVSGRLLATNRAVNRSLYEMLQATGGGDAAVGTRGVALSMTARSGEQHIAHVLPLTSGARKTAGIEYSACAAIFVRKAELEPPPAPKVIAQLYQLTPSELRVLLAVFETGSIEDIANVLGVSVPTVKTHLRRLFDKTGTRRQADLVKLVGGHAATRP
jgi:DNA-binding CsgD family transcriptional regulator/PAS domain-containing protein